MIVFQFQCFMKYSSIRAHGTTAYLYLYGCCLHYINIGDDLSVYCAQPNYIVLFLIIFTLIYRNDHELCRNLTNLYFIFVLV